MNQVDALLLVLLLPFALRGYWRGFCRESLGLAGLLGGVLGAAALGPRLATALLSRGLLPSLVAHLAAFAAIFLSIAIAARLLGRLADRLTRALLLGGFNRAAGVIFGSVKGAALLGFALLLLERVVPSPALGEIIAASRLGPPLMQLAGSVLDAGHALYGRPAEHRV